MLTRGPPGSDDCVCRQCNQPPSLHQYVSPSLDVQYPHPPHYHIRFFVQVLDADLKAYPIRSGALARIPYTNDALTELQCNLETVATNFVVNDTAPAPGGDADDDEAGEGDGAIPEQ